MKHQFKTLLLVSILLMAGCNDTPLVEEESTNTQRTFTLSATMPGGGGPDTRVAGEQDPASLDIVLKWKTGDKIKLYFDDGSNIIQGEEVVVRNISSDGKTAQFDVVVPQDISDPFDLYGVHGTSSEIDGSAILLDVAPNNFVKLEEVKVPIYFKAEGFDLNSPDQTVTFNHLGALQVITFKNTGNEAVELGIPSLKFSGTKWYYDADVSNVPVFDIVSQPSTATTKNGTFTPEQFTPVSINANDSIKLAQWIMPNEYQPPAINFMAEIGGDPQNTTVPKGERDLTLEIGHAYHLYVLWDGTDLSFAEEVYKITMTTSASELNLAIEAAQADQDDVWIDLNNNGVKNNGEEVTNFSGKATYTASSKVTLYGKVTSLDCSDNELDALDVTKNPALTLLSCYNNFLYALDVTKNPELTKLYCSENSLQELDVTKNPKLTILSCYDNYLTALDVSGNPALTKLDCSMNMLEELNFEYNNALQELLCYMNNIKVDAMGVLVDNLPRRVNNTEGIFYVIDKEDPDEENVCTKAQVDAAKDKNWKVLDYGGDLYPGS